MAGSDVCSSSFNRNQANKCDVQQLICTPYVGSGVFQDKADMQNLNDRLSTYIDRIKSTRSLHQDPSSYLAAIKQLEDEIDKIRNTYDAELNRLRQELGEALRLKALNIASAEKNSLRVGDLQNTVQRQAGDVDSLQRALSRAEKELSDLRQMLLSKSGELEQLRPDWARLKAEHEHISRSLESEHGSRRDCENKLKQACDQLTFDNQAKAQEVKDLQERVRVLNDIIAGLEHKLRMATGVSGGNLASLAQQLRDCTTAEMRRYQRETEDGLNRCLTSMKVQCDESAREKDRLAQENTHLQDAVRQLGKKNGELEAQLQLCRQEQNSMQNAMNSERARSLAQMRDMEKRQQLLANCAVGRMKDAMNERDAQASLQSEISIYKALLDNEDYKQSGCRMIRPTIAPIVNTSLFTTKDIARTAAATSSACSAFLQHPPTAASPPVPPSTLCNFGSNNLGNWTQNVAAMTLSAPPTTSCIGLNQSRPAANLLGPFQPKPPSSGTKPCDCGCKGDSRLKFPTYAMAADMKVRLPPPADHWPRPTQTTTYRSSFQRTCY